MATRASQQQSGGGSRLELLAHRRLVFALSAGLLITVLMTVFVGYHAVFSIFLGIVVGIGVALVLPLPQKPKATRHQRKVECQ
ncbi:hypothetical protein RIEGSTA812A_PEG_603 [invertebrate metagenome]|uniref:Uncharacterized protein n=1 Tax=invertebrate metagenome TaxID=1711999 RepID=A0A484H6Q2_9ZZZZ